ncbi:MAG: hypothetical protein ACRDPW_05030 [Mycobacteriales bacterium]
MSTTAYHHRYGDRRAIGHLHADRHTLVRGLIGNIRVHPDG